MGDRYRPYDPEHPSIVTAAGEQARKHSRISEADRQALRELRTEAVRQAFPDMTTAHVDKAIADWYRGKPGTGRIRRVIARAGLL